MGYYYPSFWELLDLVAVSATLVAINYLIRERWTRVHNAVPALFAGALWIGACAMCLMVALAFYDTTPDERKFPILMWCLLILAVPVAYYGYSFVDSFAVRSIDTISPFNAKIEEPSEFAQARRMALRGDIDGAVERYRQYHENQAIALFEAARLLKSVDRFVEAVRLLEEVRHDFSSDATVWAEATYQLAKTYESNLSERAPAIALLRELAQRAPNTRWGQLAGGDIARLAALEGAMAGGKARANMPPDPFFRQEDARTRFERESLRPAAHGVAEPPVPRADPFFRAQSGQPEESPDPQADF